MEKSDDSGNLQIALIGTLAIADAICIKLWLVMEEIRLALNDPHAMAFIITDEKVVSDSKKAEAMLDSAQSGFRDTESAVLLFSVTLTLITLAMILKVARGLFRGRTQPSAGGRAIGVRRHG